MATVEERLTQLEKEVRVLVRQQREAKLQARAERSHALEQSGHDGPDDQMDILNVDLKDLGIDIGFT